MFPVAVSQQIIPPLSGGRGRFFSRRISSFSPLWRGAGRRCTRRLRSTVSRGLEAAGTVGVGGGVECDVGGMAVVTGRCGHGADRQQGKACLEDAGKCRGRVLQLEMR